VRKGRWVKLYVREEGSFAQLPLYVRALGAELLKICDSTGRIALRGKAPWDAVAFQLGADLSDRRLLKKHIPLLIADGYLAVIGGDLLVRNFADDQMADDEGFTYVLRRGPGGPFKIGRSRDVEARVRQLQTGSAEVLSVIAVLPGSSKEQRLHGALDGWRMEGEWFSSDAPVSAALAELRSD
jgi:hypothetical protein